MEALRAPSEDGPRAALTWWGEPKVPEPGENGLDEETIPSLLREPNAQWGEWALA
jgi:hypothetical protein